MSAIILVASTMITAGKTMIASTCGTPLIPVAIAAHATDVRRAAEFAHREDQRFGKQAIGSEFFDQACDRLVELGAPVEI